MRHGLRGEASFREECNRAIEDVGAEQPALPGLLQRGTVGLLAWQALGAAGFNEPGRQGCSQSRPCPGRCTDRGSHDFTHARGRRRGVPGSVGSCSSTPVRPGRHDRVDEPWLARRRRRQDYRLSADGSDGGAALTNSYSNCGDDMTFSRKPGPFRTDRPNRR